MQQIEMLLVSVQNVEIAVVHLCHQPLAYDLLLQTFLVVEHAACGGLDAIHRLQQGTKWGSVEDRRNGESRPACVQHHHDHADAELLCLVIA